MYKKIYKTMRSVILFTLIVSSLFIILISYTLVDGYMRDKLEEEATIVAKMIEKEEDSLALLGEDYFSFVKSRINIYDKNGKSLIDERYMVLKDVKEAGFYDKNDYVVPLKNGNYLYMENEQERLTFIITVVVVADIIILLFIYILVIGIASALTKNIIKPLEDVYSYELDSVYPELEPFVKRIAVQGREIKRQEDKVNEQKSQLQAISENMNEGLIVIDANKTILSVNKSVLDIFGVSEEEIKHRRITRLIEDKNLLKHLDKSLSGKKEYTDYEKDSKAYQVFYSPVYEKNRVRGVVILLIDASEKMKSEQIRREFSANVSHELKTPLTAIHGYSQIITGGLAREGDVTGFAEKIEKESFRMINLIDDIIKLSRLDEQREVLEKENVSLLELSRDVESKLKNKAEKRNISLLVTGEDTVVFANKTQITEMIYNLCDNAIKYNIENGKVLIEIISNGFKISDTGIGIPTEYKDRIFERFFRVDKSHSKSINGTGLGLSIVKHVALSNDAHIEVESVLGEGSSFTVTFQKVNS